MKTEAEIEWWLRLQPGYLCQNFLSLWLQILAIQICSFIVLPAVQHKSRRIQTRQNVKINAIGPQIFSKELPHRQRPGRFIRMNASGNIVATRLRSAVLANAS